MNRQTVVGRLAAGVGGLRHGWARAYKAPVQGAGAGGGALGSPPPGSSPSAAWPIWKPGLW